MAIDVRKAGWAIEDRWISIQIKLGTPPFIPPTARRDKDQWGKRANRDGLSKERRLSCLADANESPVKARTRVESASIPTQKGEKHFYIRHSSIAMEELYSLVHCLSEREWESFLQYLSCFSTRAQGPEGPAGLKQRCLAEAIRQTEKLLPESHYCSVLYDTESSDPFDKLCSRLKGKILDFLSTDIALNLADEIAPLDHAYMRMRKMSVLCQRFRQDKTENKIALRLLKEIISLGKEYEYYLIVAEHLYILRSWMGWKTDQKSFEKLTKEYEIYMEKEMSLMAASTAYQKLFLFYDQTGRINKTKIREYLHVQIPFVAGLVKKTGSKMISYYLKMLEMDLAQLDKNYLRSAEICQELLEVVIGSPSVFQRSRVGIVYDNLSRCEYFLGQYSKALASARRARDYFKINTDNYFVACEQEFHALFALKKYAEAEERAREIVTQSDADQLGIFRHALYRCYWAFALFLLKKCDQSLRILATNLKISKDKAGWEIGVRQLRIMSLIESDKLDEAAVAVNSLKQFMKYTRKKHRIALRDKMICQLLVLTDRNGYQFERLKVKSKKYLDPLSEKEGELAWEPFTHEVIPFHEWYYGKLGLRKSESKNRESIRSVGPNPD